MPSHRKISVSTLLTVAAAAAVVALLMNRHVMQSQQSGGGRRNGGGGADRGGRSGDGRAEAPVPGLAAISPAAAAEAGDATGCDFVRPAGPETMRDAPRRGWDKTDEASDESFPASDPPATY